MLNITRTLAAGLTALALSGAVFAVAAPAPAVAQTAPTQDEAKALALKAADLIAAKGMEEAVKVFNEKGDFNYGEIYVNVIDLDGIWRAYPPRPAGVGQNVLNVKDPDGRMIVQEILTLAKDKGEGWVEYRWMNPTTNKIQPKVTYVKKVPGLDYVAYVGIYK